MDPRDSAQYVVLCDNCQNNVVKSYCDLCKVNLCMPCIGEHISDDYDKHKIVPYMQRNSTLIFPVCKTHSKETCKVQCLSCNIFICAICSISEEHNGHHFKELEVSYNSKKTNIEEDTKEIEDVIFPTYEEIRKELESQIASLDEEYNKIKEIMTKQGEKWHRAIDGVINQMENEINEIKGDHREILEKHLEEIKKIESTITENLNFWKKQRESNIVSAIMGYKSKNKELRKLPPKVHVSMPTFCPKPIDSERVYQLIGSIKPLTSNTEENGYTLKKQILKHRELLDTPKVIDTFNTGYENLRCVFVHNDQDIWTSAEVCEIKCFNIKGKSNNVITSESEQWPNDIAVTNEGCLLYSDWKCQTVNRVTNGQVEEIINLRGWVPGHLCVTSSGDLLVEMCDEANAQEKIVRYSGAIEKQTIQYEEDGKPLYSVTYKAKFLTENRNLDICVADFAAGAVVVVNQAGKLRFRYIGRPTNLMLKPFSPLGITSNSQHQILVSDFNNDCIHILDQEGQFLCYIENMSDSFGLCVDKQDNLFVAEYFNGNVKVIRYLK